MLYVDMEVNGVPLKASGLSYQEHYSLSSGFYMETDYRYYIFLAPCFQLLLM